MAETVASLTLLDELRAKRNEEVNSLSTLVEGRGEKRGAFEARDKSEDAKPSDEERSAFTVEEEEFGKEFDRREAAIKLLDRRIREQEMIEERRQEAAKAARGSVSVTSEPMTYREDNQKDVSYFRDLAIAQVPALASRMDDPSGAVERLQRHAKELNDVLPRREQAREQRAQSQVENAEREFSGSVMGARQRRGFDETPFERRTNPNRTDGQGGYFVPPLWLIDEYIPALRAGRATADLCRQMDLPQGTDSINIPKLSTTTLTGVQTADAAAVTSQDFTDTSVSAGVKTLAGQEDVAIQLIEQSPGQIIDRVVIEDLMADYNKQIDTQVLRGTGASGQVTGLLPAANWSGANTVTWTTSTPLGIQFNRALGACASQVSYNRYSLENLHFVGHPRRWFWFATETDGASGTSGRPLVNRESVSFNVLAVENDPAPFEGLVGHVPFGPNFYIDGNMPIIATSAGAVSGGSNDLVLGGKFDDFWLFEGSLRTRVLPEILSGTLQIRFQVFNYFTFLVRYGQSIAVMIGTGLGAPTAPGDTSIAF